MTSIDILDIYSFYSDILLGILYVFVLNFGWKNVFLVLGFRWTLCGMSRSGDRLETRSSLDVWKTSSKGRSAKRAA